MTSRPAVSESRAVPNPALATPSRLDPSPKNDVALTIPELP